MASSTAETGRFECPACARRFKWSEAVVGRRVKCPCGERFRVPDAPLGQRGGGRVGEGEAGVGAPLVSGRKRSSGAGGAGGASGGGRRVSKPKGEDWLAALDAVDGGGAVKPVAYESTGAAAGGSVGKASGKRKRKKSDEAAGISWESDEDAGAGSAATTMRTLESRLSPAGDESERVWRVGVNIAGVGLLGHVLGMGAMVLGMAGLVFAVAGATTPADLQQTATESLWLYGLGALGMVLGPLLGLAAPAQAGRNSIIGCLASFAGIIAVAVGLGAIGAGPFLTLVGILGIVVLYVMIFVFFMQYFADLASYIGRPGLSALALTLRKALFTLVAVGFVMGVVLFALPTVANIASVLQGIASLAWSVAYLVMAVAIGWHAVRW
ncbi:MAG: hypothetical protein AAGI68_09765 [Planctomycetota bacterium]